MFKIRVKPGGFWDRFWSALTHQPTLKHQQDVRDGWHEMEQSMLKLASQIHYSPDENRLRPTYDRVREAMLKVQELTGDIQW